MKRMIILILLISIIPICSAELPDLDISKMLPSLISQGANRFLESIGDQLYKMTGASNVTQAQNGIGLYMGQKDNFIETKGVQDQKNFNAFWFMVGYFIYLGYGVIRISKEKSGFNSFAASMGYTGTYIKTLAIGIILFMFYLHGLNFLMLIEYVIAQGFVVNAMSIMPTEPQYGLTYLIVAIGNVGVWVFLLLRNIIVYIVFMFLLWLIIFRKLPIAGYVINAILLYGIVLFFSRIIISFVFFAGTGAIEGLGVGGLVLPYIVLMLFILLVCVLLLIIPILIIKGSILMMGARGGSGSTHHHYGSNGSDSYLNEEILHE